jgi:hypothetical protein
MCTTLTLKTTAPTNPGRDWITVLFDRDDTMDFDGARFSALHPAEHSHLDATGPEDPLFPPGFFGDERA